MDINFFVQKSAPHHHDFEIVERKGRGHPDTLSDRLAERLSIAYSKLTLKKYGLVLRHQFDKLSLLGGRCKINYGKGLFVSPIRLLLNGRATAKMGNENIDFKDLLYAECASFLESELVNFNFPTDCRVLFETTSNSTRGLVDNFGNAAINYRFSPRSPADLPEFTNPLSNDTAVGYGYAPFTPLEMIILEIEQNLTSRPYPWLGTDVKIMGCRIKNAVDLTLAVPQICTEVNSKNDYAENLRHIQLLVHQVCSKYEAYHFNVSINPSDSLDEDLVYLRYTGSCIESGDEGVVGRGNRIGGVISACRPYSIEGLNGKNSKYHAGKVYSAAAWEIAGILWRQTHIPCEIFIISQIDRPLYDPWKIIVRADEIIDSAILRPSIENILSQLDLITEKMLNMEYKLA